MLIKRLLIAVVLNLLFCYGSFADTTQPCSRARFDEAHTVAADYLHYFWEQNNLEAMAAIEAVKPSKAFLDIHGVEVKKLLEDKSLQPSAAFCKDLQVELKLAKQKLQEIAKRYNYQQ